MNLRIYVTMTAQRCNRLPYAPSIEGFFHTHTHTLCVFFCQAKWFNFTNR